MTRADIKYKVLNSFVGERINILDKESSSEHDGILRKIKINGEEYYFLVHPFSQDIIFLIFNSSLVSNIDVSEYRITISSTISEEKI